MKIKTKEIVDNRTFLGYMIMDCLNGEALNILGKFEDRDSETEFEIELKFNGVELNIRKFTKHLKESYDYSVKGACRPEAFKMFEKFKHN